MFDCIRYPSDLQRSTVGFYVQVQLRESPMTREYKFTYVTRCYGFHMVPCHSHDRMQHPYVRLSRRVPVRLIQHRLSHRHRIIQNIVTILYGWSMLWLMPWNREICWDIQMVNSLPGWLYGMEQTTQQTTQDQASCMGIDTQCGKCIHNTGTETCYGKMLIISSPSHLQRWDTPYIYVDELSRYEIALYISRWIIMDDGYHILEWNGPLVTPIIPIFGLRFI